MVRSLAVRRSTRLNRHLLRFRQVLSGQDEGTPGLRPTTWTGRGVVRDADTPFPTMAFRPILDIIHTALRHSVSDRGMSCLRNGPIDKSDDRF